MSTTKYSKTRVKRRIQDLESSVYGRLDYSIDVSNLEIDASTVSCTVTLKDSDTTQVLEECSYPLTLFEDCIVVEPGSITTELNVETATDLHNRIMKRLECSVKDAVDSELADIKSHISRISTYYKWMLEPEGALSKAHYAGKLFDYILDADTYLNMIEMSRRTYE